MRTALLLVMALADFCVAAQTFADASFDVVSVKPALPLPIRIDRNMRVGCWGGPGTATPGVWNCRMGHLSAIITSAYDLQPYQFTYPEWINLVGFDIVAKMPADTTVEQFRRMQQNLLAQRFKMSVHHEKREMAVYDVSLVRGVMKLKESAADSPPLDEEQVTLGRQWTVNKDGYPEFPAGHGGIGGMMSRFRWTTSRKTMAEIAKQLSLWLRGDVIDSTGLKGRYDIDIYWFQSMPGDNGDVETGPTLKIALQDQLGLKLESKKGLVDVMIVDRLEKVPVEN